MRLAFLENSIDTLIANAAIITVFVCFISYMSSVERSGSSSRFLKVLSGLESASRALIICAWIILIIGIYLYRDRISVDAVMRYTPENPWLAAFVMMFAFAFKSISMVLFVGILYAANGIMFPLYIAIPLNIAGSAVMLSVPYFIGRARGAALMRRISEKYPKIGEMKQFHQGNDFIFSFVLRLLGMLPADLLSMYMGAIELNYPKYLLGAVLGMIPPSVSFAVMGMSITNVGSPEFAIALAIEAACVVTSVSLGAYYTRKILAEKRR